LGVLFRTTVPERALGTISALLEHARERGMAEVEDVDAAARMFAGSLLTYVLLDGLFVGDGPPRPPAPERIEEVVGLFMKVVS
jgi:TetR/AcrR family transcriptional repressor of mexJK operon